MADPRDEIVDQCFRLLHLWAAGGVHTETFSMMLNGLWERLKDYDKDDYYDNLHDGMNRGVNRFGNLNPADTPPVKAEGR